jgi:hypothetical protein
MDMSELRLVIKFLLIKGLRSEIIHSQLETA